MFSFIVFAAWYLVIALGFYSTWSRRFRDPRKRLLASALWLVEMAHRGMSFALAGARPARKRRSEA